jgi:multidrug resistance efflux pump
VAVKQAQTAYDTVAWGDDVGDSPQAAALQTATLAYEKSLATYRQKVAGATPDQIAAVQAKLTQAQQQVGDLLAGADANDIAAAQIAVEQAQASLSLARDTTALEIGVEQAQLAVDAARRNLESLALQAPFAGIVTEVNAAVGETVGTTPIVTLFDSSRAQLELYLDETDMDKLAVGNEVEVVFDALPALTFTGQIIRIKPSLVVVDGVPVISALAELDEPEIVEPAAFSDGKASPLPRLN